MKSKTIEIVLIVVAGLLFAWGLAGAQDRGDDAAKSWVTYVLAGLIVAGAANIAFRSKQLAIAVIVVSALLTLAVLVAAFGPNPLPTAAVIRSLAFFSLVVVTSCLQLLSSKAA